jgi:hypothetical protein
MIMETIASVSKALQEYECAGGFAPVIATDEEDVALAAPVAHVEPRKDVSALPQINEGREASPPPPVGGSCRSSSPCHRGRRGGSRCWGRGNIAAPSGCC